MRKQMFTCSVLVIFRMELLYPSCLGKTSAVIQESNATNNHDDTNKNAPATSFYSLFMAYSLSDVKVKMF